MTSKIPIVFVHATDPVGAGFVKSLARPGGHVTGFAGLGDVPAKYLELFKETLPELRRVLVLHGRRGPLAETYLRHYRQAADTQAGGARGSGNRRTSSASSRRSEAARSPASSMNRPTSGRSSRPF